MRVITGTARGRKLREPTNMDIRPTTDQVKEALFNILQWDIEGRRVLDLFAGTGQLGIEALSRGAASCLFLDESKQAIDIIKENVERCGFTANARILRTDSLGYLRSGERFDLILMDPPYGKGLEQKALELIEEFDILAPGGIMSIETRRETPSPVLREGYGTAKEYHYGKIKLTVITRGVET